jgi:hypothetical protein
MSKHFNYYDAWQSVELDCPICHWKGTFKEGLVGYYQELQDCSCPNCDFLISPILAIVSYPTIDEMLASGRPTDIQQADKIKQFQKNFDSKKLMNKEQLPAVNSTSFTLAWDLVEANGERLAVIRHDDRVLFSEPALWEGYKRFEQVCKIVREQYGTSVKDLVPTQNSELYLYGDISSAPAFVAAARRNFFGNNEPLLPNSDQ